MAQDTALVTGATGLLGREVSKTFRLSKWNVKGTGYSRADGVDILKADLGNDADIKNVLDTTKCAKLEPGAAQRFPDKVDKDPEGAKALNVAASRSLASQAAERDIFLIYISTDYVFPGVPGEAPYETDATPKPPNLYGQTKLDGEKVVLEEYAKAGKEGSAIVLRVPVLYGKAETPAESAVNTLLDSVWKAQSEGTKIKMDHWALRFPTCTEDVGRVCLDISTKYLATSDRQSLPRILQFSSEDKMTKYEICQRFGEIMGLPVDNIEANTEGNDPKASVQRPYDCHLSTKALRDLGIDVSTCDFTAWWRRELGAFRK
ncbi:hypothetical protein S40285_04808 [Stachybotrys chlorohalonatus IBT 40285]|uniref:RmlD-like substrate binding domain-containing protein n=1 Tax=Stachybotrys chlorohalonatus (strain IBT 40285) TaxID=1283841 RepID=A0A084QP08_STAC4|nr:hypothetical protein S40285_04808 [Stachybotrys chlorohalonata IBT 40285]